MHRLRVTRTIGIVLLSIASQAVAAEKPNILLIFADDWGWGDLSCHGHPYVKTPNIDRLAREGTDFHRFTVASGVCSPLPKEPSGNVFSSKRAEKSSD